MFKIEHPRYRCRVANRCHFSHNFLFIWGSVSGIIFVTQKLELYPTIYKFSAQYGSPMNRVLVVEDSDSDIRQLLSLLKANGVKDIQVASGVYKATEALQKAVADASLKPELLVLDLALGMDSGYEILRYWKSTAELRDIPVVVWTAVGGKVDEDICKHFRVKSFVKKQQGPQALKMAITPLLESRA